MKSFYEILGLSIDCDAKQIRAKYRDLVKLYHPDKDSRHTKIFEEITNAYTTLRNPDKRRQYDLQLQENKELKTRKQFRFREFKSWLFQFSFIRTLFGSRRVAVTPQQGKAGLKDFDTRSLIRRILYSTNIHVQLNAVQAILDQGDMNAINDLIRLLYSGISEDVKMQIVEGIRQYSSPLIQEILQDVYQGERSIKLKQRIRHSLAQNALMN